MNKEHVNSKNYSLGKKSLIYYAFTSIVVRFAKCSSCERCVWIFYAFTTSHYYYWGSRPEAISIYSVLSNVCRRATFLVPREARRKTKKRRCLIDILNKLYLFFSCCCLRTKSCACLSKKREDEMYSDKKRGTVLSPS